MDRIGDPKTIEGQQWRIEVENRIVGVEEQDSRWTGGWESTRGLWRTGK